MVRWLKINKMHKIKVKINKSFMRKNRNHRMKMDSQSINNKNKRIKDQLFGII